MHNEVTWSVRARWLCRAILAGVALAGLARAAAPTADTAAMTVRTDVAYAATADSRQTLDLYLPKARPAGQRLPVIVFVHGGGWVGGSKAAGRRVLQSYVESGDYGGVSVGYRLAGAARWPAPIHDCKAAIRWIRAHADEFGFNPDRIGVIGSSAGGTLVTLLGASGGVGELEGEVGPNLGVSSRVTCVVNKFGRLDFLAEPESARAAPSQAKALDGRLALLFGGPVEANAALARLASPISHVSADDPPVLTLHGTADQTVPIVQAERFEVAAKRAGAAHVLVRIVGGRHGVDYAEDRERARLFFDLHLRGVPAEISAEPIVLPARQ
jgi:acetyl esterase/lipase